MICQSTSSLPIRENERSAESGDTGEASGGCRSLYGPPFWLAYTANTLVCVAMALLYRYADFVTLLGGGELHLGWIIGVGWIGSVVMRLFLGRGIDEYGTRLIWLGSLLVLTATCFAHLGVSSYDGLAVYLLRIAYCTSLAGIFGASTTFVAGRVEGPRMAELIAMLGTSGFVAMMLGTQLGDLLCGGEPSETGVFRMFVAAGLASAAGLPFAWIATRGQKPPSSRRRVPMAWVVRRYHPGMILVVAVAYGASLALPMTFLRTYAMDLEIPRIGWFFTVVAVTSITTRVAIRRFPERFGLPRMILAGLVIMAFAQLLFLLVQSEWQLIVPGLAHGVAQAILFPMVTAAGTSSFPIRYRGLGTTIVLAALDIGQLIGAPVGGVILHGSEWVGLPSYPAMFSAMALVMTAVAGVYALSLRRSLATIKVSTTCLPTPSIAVPPPLARREVLRTDEISAKLS